MGVFVVVLYGLCIATALLAVISWLIEGIFLSNICWQSDLHSPVLPWVPFYRHYFYGKTAGSPGGGILLMYTYLMMACYALLLYLLGPDRVMPWPMAMLPVLAFLMRLSLTDQLIAAALPEKRISLLIWMLLTAGWLRPVFLLAYRRKLAAAGIWNLHKFKENNL